MSRWGEQDFFEYMKREPWFTLEAIAASESIMDWAGKNQRVSTDWTGKKIPIFNALVDKKRFISIAAKKGWDIEIPFGDGERGLLLERTKNQQVIARLQQMGVETVKDKALSPIHRRAIKLSSVHSCLEDFLELLDWIVDELYA
jgi:hypothetical protein